MTGWEGLTVAQLKDELKQRNVPLTGLKLKKDFIAKLEELIPASNGDKNDTVPELPDGASGEIPQHDEPDKSNAPHLDSHTLPLSPANGVANEDKNLLDSAVTPVQTSRQVPQSPLAETTDEAKDKEETIMHVPEGEQKPGQLRPSAEHETAQKGQLSVVEDGANNFLPTGEEEVDAAKDKDAIAPAEAPSFAPKRSGMHELSPGADRKRKRSSPEINGREQAQKYVKTDRGKAVTSRSRSPQPGEELSRVAREQSPSRTHPSHANQEEQMMEEEHDRVEAAKHPTTGTLYMCNFKRPINQQELKAHITAVANGAAATTPGAEPIKLFYMDKIRSHAFVALQSATHAARVRSAMHGRKFPLEPQRDAIWVDFIPDDKVEDFIDQESQSQSNFQSGGRGAGMSSRFQIVYKDTDAGVEAVLQDANQVRPVARPGTSTGITDRLQYSQRETSYMTDPTKLSTSMIASTVHPDRANLVPRSRAIPRHASPQRHGQEVERPAKRPHADQGSGFKELDDLFSSTQAKPRLYFKLPAQELVQDRLAMIRALIPAPGRSGEPGMKRYTFEESDGQEEWVDNGPEFGRGWRGQDRLEGKAGGRGRGRRRGGGYDRRGMGKAGIDSYRGEGRAAPRDWDAPLR